VIEVRRRRLPIGGHVSTYSDVTERHHAWREADEARRLLVAVMDAVPAVLTVKDADLRYRMVNRTFLEVGHADIADVIGRTSRHVTPPDRAAAIEAEDRMVLSTRRQLPFHEVERRGIDDRPRTIWTTKIPLLRDDGSVEHIVTIDLDVTERKQMQGEHERLLQLFNDAVESLSHGFAVYDRERRLVVCNSAYAGLYGETPESLAGTAIDDLAPRFRALACDAEGLDPLIGIGGGRAPERGEVEIDMADGRRLLVTRHPTAEGGFVLTRTDVTEMKRQREALYQSEKLNALGTLLAGVSHELNNPLSIVVGQSSLLQETAADEATRRRADRIARAADRCSRIVRTFLAMARHAEPQRRAVDLNGLVTDALEVTGYALKSGDIDVATDLAGDLPPVWGDPDQLAQVVMNLVVNAQQALMERPGPRRLTVASRPRSGDGTVALTVRDNGPGIPEAVRSRIFEPFFTTKPDGVGTGIGLAICRGIVDGHGGQLSVGEAAGGGAEFRVVLPAAAPADRPDAGGSGPRARSPRRTVLVVDDEADLRAMVADMLRPDGHGVIVAASGREALEVLAREPVDLVLCDLRMPDLDGPGLHERLCSDFPALAERVAFVTGDTLSPAANAFLKRTGAPVLTKPFAPAELRAMVARLAG